MIMCITFILPNTVLNLWLRMFQVSDKNLEFWNIISLKRGPPEEFYSYFNLFIFYLNVNPIGE